MKTKKLILIFGILLILILGAFSYSAFASNSNLKSGELKVTLEHPFYVDGNWIPANQLKVGDLLTTIDGKRAVIEEIEEVNQSVQVYNFEDSYFHNYIVSEDNLVVHNSGNPTEKTIAIRRTITHGSDWNIEIYEYYPETNEFLAKCSLDGATRRWTARELTELQSNWLNPDLARILRENIIYTGVGQRFPGQVVSDEVMASEAAAIGESVETVPKTFRLDSVSALERYRSKGVRPNPSKMTGDLGSHANGGSGGGGSYVSTTLSEGNRDLFSRGFFWDAWDVSPLSPIQFGIEGNTIYSSPVQGKIILIKREYQFRDVKGVRSTHSTVISDEFTTNYIPYEKLVRYRDITVKAEPKWIKWRENEYIVDAKETLNFRGCNEVQLSIGEWVNVNL